MTQNVNLYKPAARAVGDNLDAVRIAAGWALAVAVVLATQFGLEQRNARIAGEVERLQQQVAERGIELGELTAASMAGSDQALAARLAEVLREIDLRETILGIVSGANAGDTQGFAMQLRSLARQPTPGLWLTRVQVSAPGARTALDGRALNPAAVPAYLRLLSGERDLSGQRFDLFAIESPATAGGPVRFSLQRREPGKEVRFARE